MVNYKIEKRKLGELVPYDRNPNSMKPKVFKQLSESLDKFGLAELPVINTDNTIIGGNHRVLALIEKHGEDFEIECLVPEKKLNSKDVYELNIRLNLHKGDFVFEVIKENPDYNPTDLLSMGFDALLMDEEEVKKTKEKPAAEASKKDDETSSKKVSQAQESTFLFEVKLKKSVLDRLYAVVEKIKTEENVDTTPEAIEKMITFYEINHEK